MAAAGSTNPSLLVEAVRELPAALWGTIVMLFDTLVIIVSILWYNFQQNVVPLFRPLLDMFPALPALPALPSWTDFPSLFDLLPTPIRVDVEYLWGAGATALVVVWLLGRVRALRALAILPTLVFLVGPILFKCKFRAHNWALGVLGTQLAARTAYLAWCVPPAALAGASPFRFLVALVATGPTAPHGAALAESGARSHAGTIILRATLKYVLLSAVVEALTHPPYQVRALSLSRVGLVFSPSL